MINNFWIEKVPDHLTHKISQKQWDWINCKSRQLHILYQVNNDHTYRDTYLQEWMIRGYWFISYFCNPIKENLDFMIKQFYNHKIFTKQDNLLYLEFLIELKEQISKNVKYC